MILVRIIHDHHDQITLRRRKKEEENLSCYSHAIYISSICQERSLYLDTTSFTIHLIHGRFISNISSSINFFFFFFHFVFFFRIFFWFFFFTIRFIYQNFVLDRFARCKKRELLSSRCSSTCSC